MKKSISLLLAFSMLHASVGGALTISGEVKNPLITRLVFAADCVGLNHMGIYNSEPLTSLMRPHADPLSSSILLEIQGNPGAANLLHQAMLEIAAGLEPGETAPDLKNFDGVLIRLKDDTLLKLAAKASKRVWAGMQAARENKNGIDGVIGGRRLQDLSSAKLKIVRSLSLGLREKDTFPFWPKAQRDEILQIAQEASQILARRDNAELVKRASLIEDMALATARSGFDPKEWNYLPDEVWGGPEANIFLGYANPLNPGTSFPTLGEALRDHILQLKKGILLEKVPTGPWASLPVEALSLHLQNPRIRAILAAEGGTPGQPNPEIPARFSRVVEQLKADQERRLQEALGGLLGWAMDTIANKKGPSRWLPFIRRMAPVRALALDTIYAWYDQAHQAVIKDSVTEAIFHWGVRLGGSGFLSGSVLDHQYNLLKNDRHGSLWEISAGALVAVLGVKFLGSLAVDGFPFILALAMTAILVLLAGWVVASGIVGLYIKSFLARYPQFRNADYRFAGAEAPESPAPLDAASEASVPNGSPSKTSQSVLPAGPAPAGT